MKSLHLIIALLLLSISTFSNAAEKKPKPWYQVEIILFKQPQQRAESSEQWDGWSPNRLPINYQDSVKIGRPSPHAINIEINNAQPDAAKTPSSTLQPFSFTPVSKQILGEIYQRLNRSNKYQLLLHTSWIQPGLSRDKAVSVHIHSQMMAPKERSMDSDDSSVKNEAEPITLNGVLKVILSRYLHVELNLDYAPDGFPQGMGRMTDERSNKDGENPDDDFDEQIAADETLEDSSAIQKMVYRIQESRRMRSQELHYLDHPKIGILIKILPVEIPQEAEPKI